MTPAALAVPTDYEIAEFRGLCSRVGNAVEAAVYGKRQVVDLLLVSLFAGGHVLVEDVPGTGKRPWRLPSRGPRRISSPWSWRRRCRPPRLTPRTG